jgi:hypothetical protein
MPAKAKGARFSSSANQTTSFFLVVGFGSGAYSAKLLAAKEAAADEVFLMFVTDNPPVRGGGFPTASLPDWVLLAGRKVSASFGYGA